MTWILVLQIMTMPPVVQTIGLEQPSEQACLSGLAKVQAGTHNAITLDNGIMVPVVRALGCMSKAEHEARKAGGV